MKSVDSPSRNTNYLRFVNALEEWNATHTTIKAIKIIPLLNTVIYILPPLCLRDGISVCVATRLPACLSVYLFVCLPAYLFVHSSICLTFFLSVQVYVQVLLLSALYSLYMF